MELTRETLYETLLVEYASGTLDEAHALIVSTHLTLSPDARKIVAGYEAVGGSMLQGCCSPEKMKANAFDSVMAKLERAESVAQKCEEKIAKTEIGFMPSCLQKYMECTCSALGWKKQNDGSHIVHVKTTCSGSRASLLKIEGGQQLFQSAITLVLDGTLAGNARSYAKGDMIMVDQNDNHILLADQNGCVCLIVYKRQTPLQRLRRLFS